MEPEHLPYLWAAYRRGTLTPLPDGLTQDQFKDELLNIFDQVHEAHVLMADVKDKGQMPVGVGVIKAERGRAWPHAWWFPEATPRAKLEIAARYITELRKRFLLLITCQHHDKPFFIKLSRLGLIRRVGTIEGWSDGEAIALFQNKVIT